MSQKKMTKFTGWSFQTCEGKIKLSLCTPSRRMKSTDSS